VDGGSVTIDADDADADPTNELADLNLAANILTLSNPATGGNQVDLSSYVNTDTQDLSIDATGKIISLVDGGSVTIDADDADSDPANEYNTAFAVNGANLELTDLGNTLSVPLTDLGTDDQTAAEVNVVTPVDVDGDSVLDNTVEEVIQAIAPITSKAARIFYPPSIAVDASANGTFTIDLYAQYIAQYGSPTVGSAGAPAALPTYTSAELYYYVTYADPTVFNTGTMSIAADGKLTYTIVGQPSDYNSLINVVFVVK
ncbi:hypothetical protein OO010_15455, partial [Flavobacteriaceae bacterium KMM 6898]|nr:hypothetical protein [Flavobacteriaceae bacterium KMM 6898]